eukprot:15430584-Alexandrium_andersonii.AAC.1
MATAAICRNCSCSTATSTTGPHARSLRAAMQVSGSRLPREDRQCDPVNTGLTRRARCIWQ